VEIGRAFDRAGFELGRAHERQSLTAGYRCPVQGFAAAGRFFYGDVLGGGAGWAKSVLFNPRARSESRNSSAAATPSARRVQRLPMMSHLRDLIPVQSNWPSSCATARSSRGAIA